VLHNFGSGSEDGELPAGDLINVNGTLYGTTYSCNAICGGTIYSMSTSGNETIVYGFKNFPDGAGPFAGLLNIDGTLYGTTELGGQYREPYRNEGYGTVFKIMP
jgi:hypothetical protein